MTMRQGGEEISSRKDTKLWRKTLCSLSESGGKLQINAQLKGYIEENLFVWSVLFLSGPNNSIISKRLQEKKPQILSVA